MSDNASLKDSAEKPIMPAKKEHTTKKNTAKENAVTSFSSPQQEDKNTRCFDSVQVAIEAFGRGEMVIVADDESRENEGDLVCAAQYVTADIINFMARKGGGLICLALHKDIVHRLKLPMMVQKNLSTHGTPFTVSVEARHGVTTGISAHDRAHTIKTAINPATVPADLVSPGHIFPLKAKPGGVLERAGQTEASVDLAEMAGLCPAGVLCEIMDDDGRMARYPRLREFADEHKIKFITISDLISYKKKKKIMVSRLASCNLPTKLGKFQMIGYQNLDNKDDYIALTMGSWQPDEPVLVRVHSQCLTGDVFFSLRCDCGNQLATAMQIVAREGKGVVLYLPQEGRGIGLINKIKAYSLQDQGADTVEANHRLGFGEDLRTYGIGAQILSDLNVTKMRLITNNPRKIVGLSGHELAVVDRVPLKTTPSAENYQYLQVKKNKLGHLL